MNSPAPAQTPLVSIIIPAYNAVDTLAETLASVRVQTWPTIEILVVDDGSKDDTRLLAQRSAEDDHRIRVLHQPNAGVAAARNHGIREARGEYLAFVDADDLWAPTKIEAQMDALLAAGERAGLAYCWSAMIDADSVVMADWDRPLASGAVTSRLFRGNFVGNGSSALVRRDIASAVGGFDSGLHMAGVQGCEDLKFYLQVSDRAEFVVVPQHLVGYRVLEVTMSSNPHRMLLSWIMVAREMEMRHPQHRHDIRSGVARYAYWLAEKLFRQRKFRAALAFLAWFVRDRPLVISRLLACAAGSIIWHTQFRLQHTLRYGIKILPPHKGKPPPRLFGRRFKAGSMPT